MTGPDTAESAKRVQHPLARYRGVMMGVAFLAFFGVYLTGASATAYLLGLEGSGPAGEVETGLLLVAGVWMNIAAVAAAVLRWKILGADIRERAKQTAIQAVGIIVFTFLSLLFLFAVSRFLEVAAVAF